MLASRLKYAVLALHPLLAFSSVALSAELLALRSEAAVSGDIVRLGDLVSGAGEKSSLALFKAPELGKIGTIRAESIAHALAELGLSPLETRGRSQITVSRPARELAIADIQGAVRSALLRLDASLQDATISFDQDISPLQVARDGDIAVETPQFDLERGRFTVRLSAPGLQPITLTGVAESRMAVPILNRSIGRGDVVTPGDFAMEPRARRTLPSGQPVDPARLSAMVARRSLKAGQMLRAEDFAGRDLVERNQKVTVSYDQPGLSLKMAGKALAAGPAGAVVPVQNLTSKRTFEAVVTGLGSVNARIEARN